MEFAVVNNYMGPVATKVMKGYSDENIPQTNQTKGTDNQKVSSIHFAKYLPIFI